MKEQQRVTWGDLHNATFRELKKTYRLTDQQLERQIRTHIDGTNAAERRELYRTVYDKHRK